MICRACLFGLIPVERMIFYSFNIANCHKRSFIWSTAKCNESSVESARLQVFSKVVACLLACVIPQPLQLFARNVFDCYVGFEASGSSDPTCQLWVRHLFGRFGRK